MKNRNYGSKHRLGLILALVCAAIRPASAASTGQLVVGGLTIPRGGVWLADGTGVAGGGHFWVPDGALGICRVDPGGATGFQLTNCNGTAKSAGQVAVGVSATGTQYLFVPDSSRTSATVVRFQFNAASGTLGSNLAMSVPNVNTVGGGTAGGGRAVAAAFAPNGDLYVGYLKSGDIVKVSGAVTTTSTTPTTAVVGATSDGRGVNSLLFFGNDLYLAELGGFGLSRMQDPSGLAGRAACSAAAKCTAVSLNPQVSFFPGGLATDGISIYIGDSPFTTNAQILQYNPLLPLSTTNPTTYSVSVTPSYSATIGGVAKTYTQYVGAMGLSWSPATGDIYVGDDPSFSFIPPAGGVAPTGLGHLWRIPAPATPLTITSMTPATGPSTGGTTVTLTGTGFSTAASAVSVTFGGVAGTNVTCASVTSCTVRTPALVGGGTVPVVVTSGAQTASAGAFTFVVSATTNPPTVTGVAPSVGLPAGGTTVTVTGTNLFIAGKVTSVLFGLAGPGTVVSCTTTQCTVVSPAFPSGGTVDIQMIVDGQTSATSLADKFTYTNASASLYAWGITAPKGGMTFVPGNLGGHMWSSDHSQGFCRQDPLTARPAGLGTPASPGSATLRALNFAVCDDGSIGSPGQAVYDPRINPAFVNASTGASVPAGTHFIYVPDNAVKSTAVWRLTFDPNTETIVGAPEAMVPLADVRTLKPNGMALGPDGNLYITDLTEPNIRRLTGPNGDPRLQTISIVAVTGDGRGANGTIGFIGNLAYISENRAASFFDVTVCPTALGPCSTTPIPLPSGAFVAGVATDPVRGYVYAADSPGGANATIWRYNVNTPAVPPIVYLTAGNLPAAGTPEATVWVSQTAVRPWNPAYVPGGTAGFAFAFGISVDTRNGDLYITGDPTAGARAGFGTAWVAHLVQ